MFTIEEIDAYCDVSPESVVPNGGGKPEGTFAQTIGSEVDVACKNGFSPAAVKVRCEKHTTDQGIWVPLGECKRMINY